MEENLNAVAENTTPQGAEGQQEAVNDNGTDSQSQEGTENVDTSAQSGNDGGTAGNDIETAPYLEIKYNHEKKGLTREEAISWAQKGMHYESAYNALERAAALKGVSVNDFLKNLETAEDEAYRQSLVEKFGDDEDLINGMMELHEMKKQKTLDSAQENKRLEAEAREQSTTQRIAEEFSKMKKEFPELTEYSALPQAVKQAASEGMPLAYAYLLHQHTEKQKADTAKQQAAAAEKMSAGSMGSAEAPDMVGAAFLKGLLG
jgi:hypothetical protein